MSKKLIFLTSFVLVLALAGTNAAFGAFTVDVRVAASNDDAEEKAASGSMSRGSSDLELGYEDAFDPANLQIVGVRFTGVGIPKGVLIKKAWVQFTADDYDDEDHFLPVSFIVEGELGPDPVDFSSDNPKISPRPTTTASAVWDIPQWGQQAAGPAERTPDISHIIQEIIDQDGWAAGNAMVVILKDNPDNPSEGNREAESFDDDYSRAPLLHIEYAIKTATEPNPADGDTGGPAPLLQWTRGYTAVYHDVYLGNNPELGAADLMDRVPFAMYWHAPGLTPDATYYWRIDEVEADGTTIHTGDLWSFMAAGFTAFNPDPPNGYRTALPDAVLSWGSGVSAVSHDVYFGTSRADVAAGTGETFKGNQMDDTYHARGLEDGTAYYWRIDEVEADGTTKHPGEVWGLRTFDDPALIGWWKFDEGQGNIAYDSSGYGNHGIIGGHGLAPVWTLGAIDGGLELGDGKYVDIDSIVPEMTSVSFTVSIWIKSEMTSGEGVLFASNTDSSHEFVFGINNGVPWKDDGIETEFPPSVANNQWHMLTYVMDGKTAYIYVDGVLRKEDLADTEVSTETRWSIGQEWDSGPSDEYEGIVDDARFWIRPLTAEEVAEVFKGDVELAHSPQPAYSSIPDIRDATPLIWSAGENAAQHDVYFGTDELAVQGADASDTTNIYRGRQIGTTYNPSEVEFGGGPYYWRIDEYNTDGTISEGKVWNFTVADYLIVDNFEDYNDYPPDEIWSTWVDGYGVPTNGSTVGYPDPDFLAGEHYVETTIVHGGFQAMPFFYSNTGTAVYSEGTRTFAVPQNWTQEGVQTLVLYFYGTAGNTGQLYVKVSGVKVAYPGDAADIEQAQWNQWNIDLASLGVNAQSVTNMSIGMDGSGANGTLYFDDIRLYRPAP